MATNPLVGGNALGEALRRHRGTRSIEAMAEQLDVNKNTQGAYERGTRKPDMEYLVAFARQTGAPLVELVRLRVEAAAPLDPSIARDLAAAGPDGEVNPAVLTACLSAVEEYLAQRRQMLPADKKARVVVLLYLQTTEKKAAAPSAREVEMLLDLAS